MQKVHVSVGAGFENDRRDLGAMAAEALALFPGPRYLIFECLAERTLARQVQARDVDAQIALARSFIAPCWEQCQQHGIRIVSNFGGIAPEAVASGLRDVVGPGANIAFISGDALPVASQGADATNGNLLARNVYLGAAGIVEALGKGADIVVTGRVADPSLVVGPVMHELNLSTEDWDALANATLAGHLIECGTQVSGGYFADVNKPVIDLDNVGPPVASISRDCVQLSKPIGGGALTTATILEQLLYEVSDPARYITPDVVLDMTQIELADSVDASLTLRGARGHPAPSQLKSLLARHSGWLAEAEISYIGKSCGYRAQSAKAILAQRLALDDMRMEILQGVDDNGIAQARLRLAARTITRAEAQRAVNEVEALYLNGPAAGGGVRLSVTPMVETEAEYIDRQGINPVYNQISA